MKAFGVGIKSGRKVTLITGHHSLLHCIQLHRVGLESPETAELRRSFAALSLEQIKF